MKTSLVAIVLMFAGLASGQQTTAQPPAQPAASQPAAQAQPQKKEIKDPAEYNAYVGAVQQQDAGAKVSGLEAFLAQYPNSVMKEDALEALMVAYQQAGNQAKVIDAANRLLAANPNNVRGLVLLAYNERAAQKWADAKTHAERGLQALPTMSKPDGVSDADFEKQKGQLAALLESVAGFSALQLKDNATAEKDLRAAVEADPTNVENVYPLALACLTATPEDDVNGLFFIARAANLVKDPAGKAQITKFGRSKYVKYHGSDEGWNDLLTLTATTPLPPSGFTVKQYVPPTRAEQAHDLVKDKTAADLKKLSFAEWELVLSAGSAEDADKVWSVIKGVALQMEATVLKAGATELQIAASQDDIDAKRADIVLTMTGTIPPKLMPAEGSTLDFEGTPVSYTASPFVMTMEKGALLTKAAPKKPPVHRKTSQ
ncbi:MAG: tetratricopeptide repeat protein [Terriglobales bacterium]